MQNSLRPGVHWHGLSQAHAQRQHEIYSLLSWGRAHEIAVEVHGGRVDTSDVPTSTQMSRGLKQQTTRVWLIGMPKDHHHLTLTAKSTLPLTQFWVLFFLSLFRLQIKLDTDWSVM